MTEITYVGFGDSLTYGYGVLDGISFMDRFKSLSNIFTNHTFNVVNSGINGDTTREALKRIHRDVIDHNPDIITILFGSNDSALNEYQHRAIAEFELNIKEIVKIIKENTEAKIIFITPPPLIEDELFPFTTNKAVTAYSDVIKKTASESGSLLIDFNAIMKDTANDGLESYLQFDGLHLSDKGYDLLYSLILNEFKKIIK